MKRKHHQNKPFRGTQALAQPYPSIKATPYPVFPGGYSLLRSWAELGLLRGLPAFPESGLMAGAFLFTRRGWGSSHPHPRPTRPIINGKEKIPAISISSAAQEPCCYLIPRPPQQHPWLRRLHLSTWPILHRSRFSGGALVRAVGERRLQQQRLWPSSGPRPLRAAKRAGVEGSTSRGRRGRAHAGALRTLHWGGRKWGAARREPGL